MMNTDTLLKIYQTYSLEKICALSKKGLSLQYAQCEQLVSLRKELATNVSATNSILRNQIQELERQEKVRYYKNLIFNINHAIDKIDNINNFDLKCFLASIFLPPALVYSDESVQNLDEISDKEYALNVTKRINRIQSICNSNNKYDETPWAKYLNIKDAFDNNTLTHRIKQKDNTINSIKQKHYYTIKDLDSKYKVSKITLFCCIITYKRK